MTTTTSASVRTSATYKTVNPATGEQLNDWGLLEDDQADSALTRAHEAFQVWRWVPVDEKIRLFTRVADLIDRAAPDLARQTALEMGKPVAQATAEAGICSAMFRYYADRAHDLLADEAVELPGMSRTVIRREPLGVILGIEPWNAPLFQAMRATAPNLMVGNTVLLKPANICAGSTLMFDDLFVEAGFPAGVYQTVLTTRQQVLGYIAHPKVRAVTLTGSDDAGSVVGELAGKHIKPVVLELGGSDAFVVLDGADVAKAAATASTCRLFIGGQACALPKRVIVTDKVADEFTSLYLEAFRSQVIGDPLDPTTTMGPLSSPSAVAELQAQYQDAVDLGATVLESGGPLDRPGNYFKPAVLTDVTPEMRLYHEEAFGPLGLIYRVPDAEAAIELANDTKYGLGGTVFSEDLDQAAYVAARLDTGGVGINAWLGAPIDIPFGGTKASGVGRELGKTGMDYFANIKTYATA
ncbi:succinate-semialdehyde dehydrogenase [NADP(+)] (plasmid) [Mycolicibacterium madagascariense]|uniref:Succinate-semialdehyde dehydrogenase [NADP(+)] n=1 Tax=Mycolicibacterium madagascariense TaxID=212765 RepID=A0A7I7XPR8_9MYCO|nr:aldehyde dehydrogenase family protein [Mycolicibacterium madagascariense]BBZ31247.1 succinate-semialdehyde dehydrogenase [NADP(+)] [Mycolicibacterium madagascariense]